MALSGSFSTNKYNSKIGLTLSWTATQSIANNTTTIKWTLKSNGGGSGNWWNAGPVTVVIAGKTVLSQTSRFKMYGSGAYKKTGSLTVSHNNDGTKSVSMSVKAAIYSASVNCTGSHSYTLNTIPRYATITSVTNFNDTGYPTIVYENPAGSSVVTDLKARLMWTVNGTDYYTPFVNLNVAGGTYTFNSTSLPQSEKNRMLSDCLVSNTLAFKVDLQSSLSGTLGHNYKEATMTVVNANPVAPSTPLSYREANDTIYNNITHDRTVIVQNQSTLEITINDYSGAKYAQILSYEVEFNGAYYFIWASDANRKITITKPNINGTFTARMTVTDTRTNKSTATLNIPIKAWSAPTAERRIARKNSFESDTIINVTGHISSIKNSQQEELNTMTIQERHQQKGSSSWSSWITLTSGQDTTVSLNNSYEWNVQIAVADKFTTTTYSVTVPTGKPLMIYDIKRKSIGINGIPNSDNQLRVEGIATITGATTLNGAVTANSTITASGAISTSGDLNANGYLKIQGLKVRLIRVAPASVAITSAAGSVYVSSNRTLNISSYGFNHVYYVFAGGGSDSGTLGTWVGVQSFTKTAINYIAYRHNSATISNYTFCFLVVGD